ncbi:baseplate wedge subunit [Halolamina pelagica]|uniref:Baseplate wedge subunit n=1 Tax=Halolamina pelagica TaxID=699431 RepID=A0A0P7GKB2_9EURY|nr:baseplate wedge subunit [Halolamina pelagica]
MPRGGHHHRRCRRNGQCHTVINGNLTLNGNFSQLGGQSASIAADVAFTGAVTSNGKDISSHHSHTDVREATTSRRRELMPGVDRTNGQRLEGLAHIRQSVADILTTPLGSRVMRRDYGSLLLS